MSNNWKSVVKKLLEIVLSKKKLLIRIPVLITCAQFHEIKNITSLIHFVLMHRPRKFSYTEYMKPRNGPSSLWSLFSVSFSVFSLFLLEWDWIKESKKRLCRWHAEVGHGIFLLTWTRVFKVSQEHEHPYWTACSSLSSLMVKKKVSTLMRG